MVDIKLLESKDYDQLNTSLPRSTIAVQPLRHCSAIAVPSLSYRCAIAVLSLRHRYAIAVPLLCYRSAIAMLSLCHCCAIAMLSLCHCCAIAVLSFSRSHISSASLSISILISAIAISSLPAASSIFDTLGRIDSISRTGLVRNIFSLVVLSTCAGS